MKDLTYQDKTSCAEQALRLRAIHGLKWTIAELWSFDFEAAVSLLTDSEQEALCSEFLNRSATE